MINKFLVNIDNNFKIKHLMTGTCSLELELDVKAFEENERQRRYRARASFIIS